MVDSLVNWILIYLKVMLVKLDVVIEPILSKLLFIAFELTSTICVLLFRTLIPETDILSISEIWIWQNVCVANDALSEGPGTRNKGPFDQQLGSVQFFMTLLEQQEESHETS